MRGGSAPCCSITSSQRGASFMGRLRLLTYVRTYALLVITRIHSRTPSHTGGREARRDFAAVSSRCSCFYQRGRDLGQKAISQPENPRLDSSTIQTPSIVLHSPSTRNRTHSPSTSFLPVRRGECLNRSEPACFWHSQPTAHCPLHALRLRRPVRRTRASACVACARTAAQKCA